MKAEEINKKNKAIWNANAQFWDAHMGALGNDWHQKLIAPETERLLNLKPGNKLLDIGCGNGLFARKMAKKGIEVTAFDFSEVSIRYAKNYDCTNIEYHVLDATEQKDLNKLKGNKFQGLVSNMTLMDMPSIELLFSNINELMTSESSFVFSIQHPCFNSEWVKANEDKSITISNYMSHETYMGEAIHLQPEKQYYFHRPISYYINLGSTNGLAVSDFIEPVFNPDEYEGIYSKFPPVLIIKMIKAELNQSKISS